MIRQFFDWDWPGAESAFREAIRLNPNHAEAHHELSMLLSRQTRFEEALREARLALLLSPMSRRFESGVAEVQLYGSRYDDAIATAKRILDADSSVLGAYGVLGLAYTEQERYPEAVTAWRTCMRITPGGCGVFGRVQLAYIHAKTGRRADALKVVELLQNQWRAERGRPTAYHIAMDIATVFAGLGERKDALDWLERAAETQSHMLYLGVDPTYRSLRAEPRFKALLRRIGLPE